MYWVWVCYVSEVVSLAEGLVQNDEALLLLCSAGVK